MVVEIKLFTISFKLNKSSKRQKFWEILAYMNFKKNCVTWTSCEIARNWVWAEVITKMGISDQIVTTTIKIGDIKIVYAVQFSYICGT